jgi:2-hydroxy-3-keto-5-methylthiopentenyl-1-phosphate phosphatase
MLLQGILISDFDGTMTRKDFFRVALEMLPEATAQWWLRYERGEVSHFDALANIFDALRCSNEEMTEIIAQMQFEPGIREACESLSQANWRVIVVSAGCGWYIEKIFRDAQLKLEVHSNPGVFTEGTGLKMSRSKLSSYYHVETGIDKAAVVRKAFCETPHVAFAGDGRPDLEPALLVPAESRFARGWLAEELERRKESFVPFAKWDEISSHLLRTGARP